jgi:hypothetical protein
MSVDVSNAQTIITKGILIDKTNSHKPDKDTETIVGTVILVTEDIGTFTEFDTITIDSKIYKPKRPFKNNGYITEIDIVRSE